MPRLLFSVRDQDEFQLCRSSGVDLIDLKEPRDGALEPTSPGLWQWAAQHGDVDVSLALGELVERCDTAERLHAWSASIPSSGIRFAKLGWSGTSLAEGAKYFDRWRAELPQGTSPVVVAYADWRECGAPAPLELAHWASSQGLDTLLLDTFDKRRGPLWNSLSEPELRGLGEQLKQANLTWALAGSLRLGDAERIDELAPEIVAVRGGVCRGERDGSIDETLLKQWLDRFPKSPTSHAARTLGPQA